MVNFRRDIWHSSIVEALLTGHEARTVKQRTESFLMDRMSAEIEAIPEKQNFKFPGKTEHEFAINYNHGYGFRTTANT